MKKLVSVLALSLVLMVALASCTPEPSAPVVADPIKMGRAEYAAHGTKCFNVTVVAMQGDKIVGVSIDEYQFMAADTSIGVPNSDSDFGKNYPEGQVLASKMANAEAYSTNMANKGGSTVALDANFAAIEAYATGKTIAELEADLSANDAEGMIDVVTGATLVDTKGYVEAIVAAAKAAK